MDEEAKAAELKRLEALRRQMEMEEEAKRKASRCIHTVVSSCQSNFSDVFIKQLVSTTLELTC